MPGIGAKIKSGIGGMLGKSPQQGQQQQQPPSQSPPPAGQQAPPDPQTVPLDANTGQGSSVHISHSCHTNLKSAWQSP